MVGDKRSGIKAKIEIIVNQKSLVENNISLVDSDDMKPIKKEYQSSIFNVMEDL